MMQIFKKLLFSFFILIGVGLFSACTELLNDSDTAPDGSAPAIQLQAPADNSLFNRGKIIPIKSVISDKDRIKEMEVQVLKISQGVASPVIWGYKKFPKTNPVIVDTTLNTTGLEPGHYLLRFNLMDNRTNTQVKEAHFLIR